MEVPTLATPATLGPRGEGIVDCCRLSGGFFRSHRSKALCGFLHSLPQYLDLPLEVGAVLNGDSGSHQVAHHVPGLMDLDPFAHGNVPVHGSVNDHTSGLDIRLDFPFRADRHAVPLHIERAFELPGNDEILASRKVSLERQRTAEQGPVRVTRNDRGWFYGFHHWFFL